MYPVARWDRSWEFSNSQHTPMYPYVPPLLIRLPLSTFFCFWDCSGLVLIGNFTTFSSPGKYLIFHYFNSNPNPPPYLQFYVAENKITAFGDGNQQKIVK